MVNDLRAVDEQERARRTSLDYTSSPVVHNSILSAAFQVQKLASLCFFPFLSIHPSIHPPRIFARASGCAQPVISHSLVCQCNRRHWRRVRRSSSSCTR
jgi:hypothetical protein